MELNKVYVEDCIKTLLRMPDDFLDATITSPPYDGLRVYDGFSFDVKKISEQLFRTTKPGGVVVWVVSDETKKGSESGTSFKQALQFMAAGFNLHDTMIWDKVNVFGTAGNPALRYQQAFEYIFIFSKGRINTFNPITAPCKQLNVVYKGRTRRDRRTSKTTDCLKEKRNIKNKDRKIVNNIFKYPVGFNKSSSDKIAFKHPAIFPEKLAFDNIISWTNEGDIVYDCFGGSGTTAKMAHKLNRNWILSELSEKYVNEITLPRLAPYLNQNILF